MYQYFFKRFLDFLISFISIVVLTPIILVITLLLAFVNKGKPFFFQVRPGFNEKLFKIVKFKTMTDATDADGNLLPDNERMTKVGNLVRKTSLDELPQLWSVLKGDMSLIGPRPLLPEYLPLYNNEQKKRHLVKPGITGWAQINGRNAISWQQKFEYDVWYANNISFLTDVNIFFKTFAKVFKSEGISTEGQVTTMRFKGNA